MVYMYLCMYIWIYTHMYKRECMLSHFSHVQPLRPYGQQPTRLLCPWNSLGKNTGVGCHFLLQYKRKRFIL